MSERPEMFFRPEKDYKEKPDVFASTASEDPKYNKPHSIYMGSGQSRHFQAPVRLSPENLTENIFYVLSTKTGKLYEITQDVFYNSPWKISEPKDPIIQDGGVFYPNLSNGRSYKFSSLDELGCPLLEEIMEQE